MNWKIQDQQCVHTQTNQRSSDTEFVFNLGGHKILYNTIASDPVDCNHRTTQQLQVHRKCCRPRSC